MKAIGGILWGLLLSTIIITFLSALARILIS
jgi:hypothetical protein